MKKALLIIVICLMVLTSGCENINGYDNEIKLKVSYASESIEDAINCNLIYDAIEQLIMVRGKLVSKTELENLIKGEVKESVDFQVEIKDNNCIFIEIGENFTYCKQGKIIIPI